MTGCVLIVEDNERNLKLVRDVLGHAGCDVAARGRGGGDELARARAARRRPDGHQSAGDDGRRGAGGAAGGARDGAIPVAAFTAYAMNDDRARMLAAGFDGYLEKPVDVRALPGAGRGAAGGDPRRRRPAAERAAAAGGARAARATRWPRPSSGEEALSGWPSGDVDLVLLDVVMPGMDGYEVCRRIRADPATAFLPVVMITASGEQEKRRAIEAGADDFVTKPFDQAELLARVRSLLRVKRYHDEIEAFNRGLRRFLPPEVAELVKADPSVLDVHRREIAVVFCALDGFAAFAEGAEPEDVMAVLDGYHAALGELVDDAEGTLVRLTGDELMIVFNDPLPCDGARRRGRSGSRSRCATACGSSPRAGTGSASTSSSPPASRSATRRSAGSASSGAGSTRRSAPSRRSPSACARAAAPGQILIAAARLRRHRVPRDHPAGSASSRSAASRSPPRLRRPRPRLRGQTPQHWLARHLVGATQGV